MKRVPVWLILLLIAALLGEVLRERRRHASIQSEWAALRFRDSSATLEMAAHLQGRNQRLHAERLKAGFQVDVSETLAAEMNLWQRQFHLGDQDRSERMAMQGLNEAEMRARIREALLDQAFWQQHHPAASVSEDVIRAWYEAHREQLRLPGLHHVSHLFLTAHDPQKPDRQGEIQALAARLAAGESFADLALTESEDARSKARGGDLGWISPARMPEDFMAAVRRQPVGKPGPPVRTGLGWHILLVHERRDSRLPALEEVRAEIAALLELRQQEAQSFNAP